MTFTTSVVGSFPRPKSLIDAFEKRARGKLRTDEFQELVNEAVRRAIRDQESAGLDVVTDGEQRRTSFVAFVGQKIPGFKLVHVTELTPRALDIMKQHKAQLTYWRAIASDYVLESAIALDEFEFAKGVSRKPLKVTLPSPYLLMWETWHREASRPYYPKPEDLAKDCVKVVRQEIVRLRDAGAAFVQLDEPMVGDLIEASEDEPDRYRKVAELIQGQKYRGFRNELSLATDLVNETVQGIAGVRIGIHMDRWPNADSPYYGVGYEKLLPHVLEMRVRQYVLEYACPGSGDPEKFVPHLPKDREIGLGVIDIRNRRVEKPSEVVARGERVAKHVDPANIWLNPDCGFAPGMSRPFPREVAIEKIRSMVTAAHQLRQKFGG